MDAYTIANWTGFLAVVAGVTATLTGLIFVAVAVNLSRILEFPGLPERAAEPILLLSGALVVAIVALVPGQSRMVLSTELTLIGLALWIFEIVLQRSSVSAARRAGLDQRRSLTSRILPHLATLPVIISGVGFATATLGGLYWLVLAFVFAIIAGVLSAWVMLIEILR